jgi:hypothetical protein
MTMVNRLKIFFFILILSGCARVQTLNLEPHQYSERPQKIVWIQIAGFSEEHIPLLKFNVADSSNKTSFETSDCLGKVWSYNLYELRPNAYNSFMSQITGSKNIKGTCEDYELPGVWNVLGDFNYSASVLENGVDQKLSLEAALNCPNNKLVDLTKMRLWRMGPSSEQAKKTFHYQDPPATLLESMKPGLYFDRSCQKGLCFSSLSNNFKSLWSAMSKVAPSNIFLVRDFNFYQALKKKSINEAKESLQEIDRMVSWIKKESDNKALIIISGAETYPIELPAQGKEWAEFEKSGKNVLYHRSSLMSPVLAYGSMSENFCGLFDESEMYKRVIHRPAGKEFSWDYINPL